MRRNVAIEIIAPTEGIERRLSPSMIPVRNTPNEQNSNVYFGVVQKDYGTTIFATGTGPGIVSFGAPTNLIYEANFGANTTLQVFTHTAMYKYLPLVSSTGDSFIKDGPTTGTAAYGGAFTSCWSICMHNDAMIYTNGSDLVQGKLTYSVTGTDLGSIVSSSVKCVAVVSVADHLCFYGGATNPKGVQWTKAGLLGYTSTDMTSGTAGFLTLQDMEGAILTAERIGNAAAIVYGEGSIHVQEWVGGSEVYRFTKMIVDKGIPSKRGVVANGTVHYVLTRDNIYEYSGGRDMKPIGDAIKADYISNKNDAGLTYAFLDFIAEDDELRVYIPTGTSTQPNTCYVCKVNEDYKWHKLTRNHTSKGSTSRTSGITIGQLKGTIGAQNWKFGDMSVGAGALTRLNGELSGRIVKLDKTVYSVSQSGTNTPQTFVFDTKDLSSVNDIDPLLRNKYQLSEYMDNQTRWLQVKVEAKGYGSMYLQYSVDGGVSFANFDDSPFTLGSDWLMYTADVDIAAPRFMVRVTNTATNEVVHFRYLKAELVVGAEG